MWRYRPLLPLGSDVRGTSTTSLGMPNEDRELIGDSPLDSVGWTPLYHAKRLGAALGLDRLLIKDDGRNPTGSFKDRASALVVARARELGERVIATASTGNAAAALAGMAAAVGTDAIIFVPESAPEPKIAQLLVYGATVLLVRGNYDEAYELCRAGCERWGWYCRNTGYNPQTTAGKKTCAFEIAEQLDWDGPDVVVVSMGDGNIITGLHQGFVDLFELGWIDRMPRLIGVQAARSPAIWNAWHGRTSEVTWAPADSIADSINAGLPRDGWRALRAMRETGGDCLVVEDEAILDAIGRVARLTGVFAEPAGAAAFAGLFQLVERMTLRRDERVVVVSTGSGLKDVRAALKAAGPPITVSAQLSAVRDALRLD